MVLREAMKKLQLKTKNQPYKLTWLNKNTEIIMDKWCLMSFLWERNIMIVFGMSNNYGYVSYIV